MKHDLVTMGNVTSCGACGATLVGDAVWFDNCPGAITIESVQAKLDAGARVYTRDEMKDLLVAVKDHTGDRHLASQLFHPHRSIANVPDDEIQNVMAKAMKAYPDIATTLRMSKPVTTGLKMDAPPMPGAIDVTNIDGPATASADDEPEYEKQYRAWALESNRAHGKPHCNTGMASARYWFKRGWEAKGNSK